MARIEPNDRLGLAATLHVVAFLAALILALALPAVGVLLFAPLVIAQSGLLTTSLMLGGGRLDDRLGLWLGATLFMALPTMCLLLPLAMVQVIVLAVFRRKVASLYFYLGDGSDVTHRRLQFTIKHLMIATLAVAMVLAGARGLRALGNLRLDELTVVLYALGAAVFVIGSQLFALWAVLGGERPVAGVVAAAGVAALLGAVFAYGVDEGWEVYLFLVPMAIGQSVIFALSLLTYRAAGYRLFRPPSKDDQPAQPSVTPAETTADEIRFLDEAPQPK